LCSRDKAESPLTTSPGPCCTFKIPSHRYRASAKFKPASSSHSRPECYLGSVAQSSDRLAAPILNGIEFNVPMAGDPKESHESDSGQFGWHDSSCAVMVWHDHDSGSTSWRLFTIAQPGEAVLMEATLFRRRFRSSVHQANISYRRSSNCDGHNKKHQAVREPYACLTQYLFFHKSSERPLPLHFDSPNPMPNFRQEPASGRGGSAARKDRSDRVAGASEASFRWRFGHRHS